MSKSAFKSIAAALDGPLVIVTTAEGGERAGCLVGFHVQSSIDPERYAIWLSKANHTYRVGLRASHFALHFLTDADLPLAERFGTQTGRFAGHLPCFRLVAVAGSPGGQGDLPGQSAPAEDVLDLVLVEPTWRYGRPGRHHGRGRGPQQG